MLQLDTKYKKGQNQKSGSANEEVSELDQLICDVFSEVASCNATITFDIHNKFKSTFSMF